MGIIFLLMGIIVGSLVYVIAFYVLDHIGYIIIKKETYDSIDTINIVVCGISVTVGIIGVCACLIGNIKIPLLVFIGVLISFLLTVLFVCYTLFSKNGKLVRLSHKIEKIKNNVSFLQKCNMTEKQRQAVKLLNEAQKKLQEQVYDMFIMDSIKTAKNIELSNKAIDIQRELDELESLQILNKG
jgi:hypothetical protein